MFKAKTVVAPCCDCSFLNIPPTDLKRRQDGLAGKSSQCEMEKESINQSFEPQILKGIYYTGPLHSIIAHYSKSAILALGSSTQIYLVTFMCLTVDTSFISKKIERFKMFLRYL